MVSWSRKPHAPQTSEASFRNAEVLRDTLAESRLHLESKAQSSQVPWKGAPKDAWGHFMMSDFLKNGLEHK